MQPNPTEEALVQACRAGNVTLVLGAGVSYGCGIPTWDSLARRLWRDHCSNEPWPLDGEGTKASALDLPNFLPFVFEHVAAKMPEPAFAVALQQALYRDVRPSDRKDSETAAGMQTLSVLARKITRNLQPDQHRIARVVTLNVDDMLEIAIQASWESHGCHGDAPIQIIARPSHHNRIPTQGAILPVFHVHGYVPYRRTLSQNTAPDALVFTDAQYWGSTANPLSFANRVVSNALHDSTCVFIGLSMTDINLLRWLGLRYCELVDDRWAQADLSSHERDRRAVEAAIVRSMTRHFWIRPDDGTARTTFLSRSLERRGVQGVSIQAWDSTDFASLMRRCFNRTEG